jgi:type II protein arginine methyltransferase
MQPIDALKKMFRDGRHAEAIAECEALRLAHPGALDLKKLCATMYAAVLDHARALSLLRELHIADPKDADVLFNIGMCERESGDFKAAETVFKRYVGRFPDDSAGWASLAECQFQLRMFAEGIVSSDRAVKLDPASVPAWITRGHCLKALRRVEDALTSYKKANRIRPSAEAWLHSGLTHLDVGRHQEAIDCLTQAIGLAPELPRLRVVRGDTFNRLGKSQEAVADYRQALKLDPGDDETLKKASVCLLQAGHGIQAVELCREIMAVDPDRVTAKLGAEWVLSQLVPLWHVPMMNEHERNQAYQDGLRAIVTPEKVVFEVGTGSGLLAMMAARLGAKKVFTCEAVPLIAETPRKIVERNGFADRITVLAKPSHAVQLGPDMPARADVLVHEIFSSELLGEHVLPAIEDAKRRLLAPGGDVLPGAASIMIALVGGETLGRYLHVGQSFGFDLGDFNGIHPTKVPLYREDLAPVLLSEDVAAFRFDFRKDASFPADSRTLDIRASADGLCYGVIQWIHVELGEGIAFENHPSRPRAVTNWQQTIYGFGEPIRLAAGSIVSVRALHDRSRPWFELIRVEAA